MPIEILDTNYTRYIRLLGTAHFTKRSVQEASEAVKMTGTRDLAIELDSQRFNILNRLCIECPEKLSCPKRCEFVAASDALGNVDANIWLIDMSEAEIVKRIERASRKDGTPIAYISEEACGEDLPWLWERGYKEEVLRRLGRRLGTLSPARSPIWRILIEERDALMAARLTDIASQKLEGKEGLNILALIGAAHVEGVYEHLKRPWQIPTILRRHSLPYSPPTLVRRIHVNYMSRSAKNF
ncbi:MAG: hypothetical protein QW390_04545 [Candidatus Bathyarchaeia archaeon]